MSRQTQSYDDKAIRGEELESLATSIAQKIVDNGQVVAEALDELDARTRALENRNPDVLGDAVADSLDAQVLKIGGQPIDTSSYEQVANKVRAWQTTPDNTHYPSEKLVKDSLNAKADSENAIARYDARVATNTNNRGWYKLAEVTTSSTTTTYNSSWSVDVATSISNVNLMSFTINLAVRLNGSGVAPEIRAFKALCLDNESIGNSSIPSFFVIVNGNSGNVAIQLWYYYNNVGSVLIRELCSGINLLEPRKRLWTYYTYNLVAGSDTKPTGTLNKDIDFIYAQTPIASPTDNNLVAMDANGLVKDSGLAKSSVESAISSAGSAIQGVKVNNTTLTPDANKVVTVPLATTSADGAMSAADKTKLNGIEAGAEVNVQADWDATSGDALIKNKPYYTKDTVNAAMVYKVCSFSTFGQQSANCFALDVICRYGTGGFSGRVIFKNGAKFYCKFSGSVPPSDTQYTVKLYYHYENSVTTVYADSPMYVITHYAPALNFPKSKMDFTGFATAATIPTGATEITPVWVASSASSSGTAPVKVDAYGALTPVPMDATPTASSTNLMTSGDIKTALDLKAPIASPALTGTPTAPTAASGTNTTQIATTAFVQSAVANDNKHYPFGVRQNRNTSYGYRLFNVKFSTAQSANKVRISGNIVVGTTGDNEHISFDLVIANVYTVENNPSAISLLTTSSRRGSRIVRLAYKRPSNWADGLDVFILWNAAGTATAANDTYGWEITQQEATLSSGVEVKDENLTSALTGFTLDTPRTAAITEGTSAIGSTSVPVYANENGVITPCTDDFVHDGDVVSTYSSTGTAPVNGTAVAAALATSLTDVEFVANASGGGGNLNKTKNGSTTSVLAFMTTDEATSLWQSAWAAAN